MMKKLIGFVSTLLSLTILTSCGEEAASKITFKYVTNGGTEIKDIVVDSGNKFMNFSITKDGYIFDGWYQDEALTHEVDYTKSYDSDATFYCKWKQYGIYASSNGNGTGSIENPYSLKMGLSKLTKDEPLFLLGGTYKLDSVIRLSWAGNPSSEYKIWAFNDQEVVFDFGMYQNVTPKELDTYNSTNYLGLFVSGNHYNIKGITVYAAGSSGIKISGSYNTIENCILKENGNTGLQISGSGTVFDLWPHDNTIKNCTSYGNNDWNRTDGNPGEDADGFGSKLTAGNNNKFLGCIAYNNSDDGWDLFTKQATGPIGPVTLENCIAYRNGYALDNKTELKNGNGFKLGGRAIEVDHYLSNCLAFENKANGFDDNSNPGTITLKGCTAYKNGSRNYAMGRFGNSTNTYTSTWYEGDVLYGPIENVPMSHNVVADCVSYESANPDSYIGRARYSLLERGNYQYKFTNESACHSSNDNGVRIDKANPFKSITTDLFDDPYMVHKKVRDKDGNIKLGDYLTINENVEKMMNRKIGAFFN